MFLFVVLISDNKDRGFSIPENAVEQYIQGGLWPTDGPGVRYHIRESDFPRYVKQHVKPPYEYKTVGGLSVRLTRQGLWDC